MPSENVSWREEISINIEGGTADEHEIPVDVLVESLTGLNQIINRTRVALYGRKAPVSVKIRGGFFEGSFDFKIVLDYLIPVLPLIPTIAQTILQIIEYKKFTRGEKSVKITPDLGSDVQTSNVENNYGNIMNVNTLTINVADSSQIDTALKKTFSPLRNGAKKMEIENSSHERSPVIVTQEEEKTFLNAEESAPLIDVTSSVVEILTAQMDGRQKDWRFYDVEDDYEFSANVTDQHFLNEVSGGHYAVLRHKHANATVQTERQIINSRRRTTRTILTLTPMSDEEERLQFA